MENKKSSIDWLEEQSRKQGASVYFVMQNYFEEAKAMHREEIGNAINSNVYIGGATEEEIEDYYNETFGNEKN
jgi:hypothetical protein